MRYSTLLKAMGRNVNYHKQAAEVTDGIWKTEASWGHQKQGSFEGAGKSAEFPGSKAVRRKKPLQEKKKKTCIRFHHRNVERDVCPKNYAEEIIKLNISMAQWLCLWLLGKFRNGKSAAVEVCFLAVEMLKPSKSMCWRVSENCRAESISKPQNVG